MRRAVRRPVSRLTTAPISSSVCRLPFISASALPSRTSCDRLRGRGVAVRRVDELVAGDVDARAASATASMRARGPTRIGAIRPELGRVDRARRASSRRTGARPRSASAAAPWQRRSGAGTSRGVPCGISTLVGGRLMRRASACPATRRRRSTCCGVSSPRARIDRRARRSKPRALDLHVGRELRQRGDRALLVAAPARTPGA